MNQEIKTCQNCKNQFTIELEDFNFYEKIKVPPPTFCPECRLIRRLAWMGYRTLYKHKCDFTGEMVFTTHHPDAPRKVYKQEVWWSDQWDPKSYGKEYDFSKPFFAQFQELLQSVPFPSLHTESATMIDSPYCNAAASLKNCYLCFQADYSENCAYIKVMTDMKECFDIAYSNFCELSYELVNANKCYQSFYSQDFEESHNIYFSKDLVGCSNCIGCVNLRNKNHCIFNEQYSKEEYAKFLKDLDLGSYSRLKEFKDKADKFILKHPRKEFYGRKNVNVSGDYIYNSKNVRDSYMIGNSEDLRYCHFLKNGPAAQCYDYSVFGAGAEWMYDCIWDGLKVNNIKFSVWNYGATYLDYCFGCHSSNNLFGCVGIRKGEYCILNKPYSKEEYISLVAKIKEQMNQMPYQDRLGREYRYGEMLPNEIGPWAYNESYANEFYPLNKEEALVAGFNWRDSDPREYQAATYALLDHIKDAPDSIVDEILKCETCGKNYRIIKMELDFYRRFSIPIPRACFFCRDNARVGKLNSFKIHVRNCMKCNKKISTSYSPERPEIVYCEQCYQNEIV